MDYTEIKIPLTDALELSQFKEMDYYAVENYALPIELMMENAGLQLANLVANSIQHANVKISIGIGNGNNGGGGLVAARRLAAWGYAVHLDISTEIDKELPQRQLERAVKFGAKKETPIFGWMPTWDFRNGCRFAPIYWNELTKPINAIANVFPWIFQQDFWEIPILRIFWRTKY